MQFATKPLALAALALCGLGSPALVAQPGDGPRAAVGEVSERRSTRAASRLRVRLQLLDMPEGARRGRVLIDKATDDAGRDLAERPEPPAPPQWASFEVDNGIASIEAPLKPATRRSTKITELSGTVEAFVPRLDPASEVVLADWRGIVGKALEAPALAENGVGVRLLSARQYEALPEAERDAIDLEVEDNSLVFLTDDPQGRLAGVELVDERGRVLRPSDDDSNRRGYSLGFNRALSAGTRLRLLVATPKSLIRVPFAFRDVELP